MQSASFKIQSRAGVSTKGKLAGTVADLQAHDVVALLVYCENHDCGRKGTISLDDYPDTKPLQVIRRAVYCPACREARRNDKNVDVRPEWPTWAGPGRVR